MNHKNLITACLFLTFVFTILGFRYKSNQSFNYKKWQTNLLSTFDSLSKRKLESSDAKSKESKKQEIARTRSILADIDEIQMKKIIDSTLYKNPIKDWSNMYLIYKFMEGEVMSSDLIFVFYKDKTTWSIGYAYNNGGAFFKTGKTDERNLKKVISKFGIFDDTFYSISKFDRNLNCQDSKIVIGNNLNKDEYIGIRELYQKER